MNDLLKNLTEYLETPEGKEGYDDYFDKLDKRTKINKGRYKRFDEWLKHNDFDNFMYRLILEHGEEWSEKCWHNGREVFMNNKLSFVFNYITHNFEQIKVTQIKNDIFPCQCWFFNGYYFRLMHGQGSVVDIYNGDDFKHLLSV